MADTEEQYETNERRRTTSYGKRRRKQQRRRRTQLQWLRSVSVGAGGVAAEGGAQQLQSRQPKPVRVSKSIRLGQDDGFGRAGSAGEMSASEGVPDCRVLEAERQRPGMLLQRRQRRQIQ